MKAELSDNIMDDMDYCSKTAWDNIDEYISLSLRGYFPDLRMSLEELNEIDEEFATNISNAIQKIYDVIYTKMDDIEKRKDVYTDILKEIRDGN